MRESSEYLKYLKENGKWLVLGLVTGLSIGIGIILQGGQKTRASQSLELGQTNQVSEQVIIADEAVSWIREVAKEQGLVDQEAVFSAYKEGPLMVKIELIGGPHVVDEIGAVSKKLVSKYGFRVVTNVRTEQIWRFSWIYVLIAGMVGGTIALVCCLLRSYRKNY